MAEQAFFRLVGWAQEPDGNWTVRHIMEFPQHRHGRIWNRRQAKKAMATFSDVDRIKTYAGRGSDVRLLQTSELRG